MPVSAEAYIPGRTIERENREVPLWRLHLLRATYLLMIVGLALTYLPALFVHPPQASGIVPSLLAGIWLLAWFGLRYPLQMLPLLMFEFAWKTVWVLAFGLPLWRAGQLTADSQETLKATMLGVILMPIAIPWGYVARHYLKAAGDRWI